jgi:hypothetical protein
MARERDRLPRAIGKQHRLGAEESTRIKLLLRGLAPFINKVVAEGRL